MADNDRRSEDQSGPGLGPDELEAEAGEEVPDRQAMSLINPGAGIHPLPPVMDGAPITD